MALGLVMFALGRPIFGEVGKRGIRGSGAARATGGDQSVPENVVRDRLVVIGILSFFTIFFWMAFEQAGGSMTIFAKDYTGRVLSGSSATAFFWANTLLTIIPLILVTYVLIRLIAATYKQIPWSNFSIALSFVLIWVIALWMLNKEFNMKAYLIEMNVATVASNDAVEAKAIERTFQSDVPLNIGDSILLLDRENKSGNGKLKLLDAEQAKAFDNVYTAKVLKIQENETEVPASWFGILNSFFIIALAPLLSKVWESKANPSAPVKFGLGLILLGIGFGVLALGSSGIPREAKSATVSMWWLILAYFFHTVGELCVSPVGLSYVSKLAPLKLVGLMFGIWFIATAVANYLAGLTGSYIDPISETYGLNAFFLIYTVIPILSGLLIWLITPRIRRMMHGID
jgi:POT family proton-dependent oligopeptide transporter